MRSPVILKDMVELLVMLIRSVWSYPSDCEAYPAVHGEPEDVEGPYESSGELRYEEIRASMAQKG